jgi:WD40 repeat protein
VRLRAVATGRPIGDLPTGHTGSAGPVVFSPDGKTLATGNDTGDGTVRLWDMATRRPIGKPITGSGGPVAFSPDGKTLATTGSDDGTVRQWDAATGRPISDLLTGHTGLVWSVAFSLDGKTLATGSDDGTVRLWDVPTRRQVGRPIIDPAGVAVVFSPDGKTMATGHLEGGDGTTVRLRDVATGRPIGKPIPGTAFPGDSSVAFSPDGKTMASGMVEAVALWDVATGRQISRSRSFTGRRAGRRGQGGEDMPAFSVAFSPDGKTLATGGEKDNGDGTVRLWDVAAGPKSGGELLLPRRSGSNSEGGVYVLVFSPDGKTLATGSGAGTVRLWDVATHRQIGKPITHPVFSSAAFSPDGKTLATGGGDGVRLWDVATHRQIGDPLTSPAESVVFSPDGKTLATVSRTGDGDGTVRLWDVATGRQIRGPFTGHTNIDDLLGFSPDGKTLTTGSDDGTVQLWNVTYLIDTVRQLCASAERSLTRAEWTRYVPPGPAYQRLCS